MKLKSAPLLSSILLCSLATNTPPAPASQADLEAAEASVKKFEMQNNTSNSSYSGQLMYLAGTYLNNGMRKEADAAFNKAIESCKARPDGTKQIPRLMLNWSLCLASPNSTVKLPANASKEAVEHAKTAQRKQFDDDFPKAEKIMLAGLALANAMPAASSERIDYMLGTVNFYKIMEKKPQEQARTKALDEHLQALENDKKLKSEEITQVAYSLVQMANLYCAGAPTHLLKRMNPEEVVSDDAPDKPNTVKAKDFKIAEAYQLRAIAQYDRLPETVPWRLDAHRSLIIWYRHFGKAKEEEFQTEQLCKLMHTTDRNLLFPQSPPCPGCGMG